MDAAAPALRVIARHGAGVDGIDLAAAEARGLTVTRAAGANSRSVAEHAMALMLAALKDLPSVTGATVFERAGLRLDIVRAGCCGMAGTYGHHAAHRDVSERIFDLSWCRHLTDGAEGEVLATGYSCRSQTKRLAGTAPRHPVTALLRALRAADFPDASPTESKR